MSSQWLLDPVVEAACRVAVEHADVAERERRLPVATVAALAQEGLTRLLLPERYGGWELDPVSAAKAFERLGAADGAAGWCAMIASTTASTAVFLDPEVAIEMYSERDVVTGGVFAPNGRGVVDAAAGTVTVNGRWQWGSGTQHCRWIVGGVGCDDGVFRLCFFDAADVTFHDTWHTTGLRGSGSVDFEVTGAVVPLRRSFEPARGEPKTDDLVGFFPSMALLASGVASVALGIADRAIAEVAALATAKRPQFSSRTLAQSGFTQVTFAQALVGLDAGRALLHAELDAAWDRAVIHEPVELEQRASIRRAAVHATQRATEAVDAAYTIAGGSSVYSSNVLQRCLRDVHVTTQHIMVAPKLYETLGKLALGLDADTTNL